MPLRGDFFFFAHFFFFAAAAELLDSQSVLTMKTTKIFVQQTNTGIQFHNNPQICTSVFVLFSY